MSEGLMSIGIFFRSSLLSIKSPRAYQKAGILVPARVDASCTSRLDQPDLAGSAAVLVLRRRLVSHNQD